MSSAGGSAPVIDNNPLVTNQTTQDASADVMSFTDQQVTVRVAAASAPLKADSLGNSLDLQDFLGRWTSINTCTWLASNSAGSILMACEPWYQFLTNTAISRKIAGFRRLHATMEVRFVLNAASTQFGLAVIGACPQGTEVYTSPYTNVATNVQAYDTLPSQYQIYAMDHVAELRPADSNSVEFSLPWCAPYDAIDLLNLDDTQNANGGGMQSQWRLQTVVVVPLGNSTDMLSIPSVSIRCFARLKDVKLDMPYPQSQSAKGKQGIVGRVAASVANTAGLLRDVPMISSVARGTEVVAAAIGGVADYFGFTRENSNPSGSVCVSRTLPNPISADAQDLDIPLGFLKDNKVSIDPAITGQTDADVSSFASLCARRQLIGTYSWPTSDTSGTLLAQIPVHPWPMALNTGHLVYMSPCAVVASCFGYWRGDMIYEIEIPASKQHRGRLQIVYYPTAVTSTEDATNSSYNVIFDLDIEKVHKFRIGWAQLVQSLPVSLQYAFGYNSGSHNGYFQIIVQTQLTAPETAAAATICVFARGGSELQFGRPVPLYNNTIIPQGPGDDDIYDLVPTIAGDSMGIVTGESVTSIRTLMQVPMITYVFTYYNASAVATTTNDVITYNLGYDFNPFASSSTGTINYGVDSCFRSSINLNYWRKLSRMFLGFRGSFRFKVVGLSPYTANGTALGQVPMLAMQATLPVTGAVEGFSTNVNQFPVNNMPTATSDMRAGNSLEVRAPFFGQVRYKLGRIYASFNQGNTGPVNSSILNGVSVSFCTTPFTLAAATSSNVIGLGYESVGEDFSLAYFRFVTPYYFSTVPT